MGKRLKIDGEKKKTKWNLFKGENDYFNGPQIEMLGNRRMTVEGCLGVYEYNENYLKLKCENSVVIISGNDFSIISFEGNSITVGGKISNLEFCM